MTIIQSGMYRQNGRIRGTYVYLVLCEDRSLIHVKVGVANEPIKRLRSISVGCPIQPGLLACFELPNRTRAFRAESNIRASLAESSTRGEWFCFDPSEKATFNARLREAMVDFHTPSRPVVWTIVDAAELLRHGEQHRRYVALKRARRSKSQKDFLRHRRQP